MELFLNSVWLFLSLLAFTVWVFTQQRATDERGPKFLQGAVLVACVLVLLFPIISATDDLHGAQIIPEDASAKKMRSQAADICVVVHNHAFPNVFPNGLARPSLHTWGWIGPESASVFSVLSPLPSFGRAPPAA